MAREELWRLCLSRAGAEPFYDWAGQLHEGGTPSPLSEGDYVLNAYESGELVGSLVYSVFPARARREIQGLSGPYFHSPSGRFACLHTLYVVEHARGRGLARRLLERLGQEGLPTYVARWRNRELKRHFASRYAVSKRSQTG